MPLGPKEARLVDEPESARMCALPGPRGHSHGLLHKRKNSGRLRQSLESPRALRGNTSRLLPAVRFITSLPLDEETRVIKSRGGVVSKRSAHSLKRGPHTTNPSTNRKRPLIREMHRCNSAALLTGLSKIRSLVCRPDCPADNEAFFL